MTPPPLSLSGSTAEPDAALQRRTRMRLRTIILAAPLLVLIGCGSSTSPLAGPASSTSIAPTTSSPATAVTTTSLANTSPSSSVPSTESPATDAPTTVPPASTETPPSDAPPTTVSASVPTSGSTAPIDLGDIAGSDWNAVSRITVGGLQPLTEGASFTLDADGHLVVSTGCNIGTATVTPTGPATLDIGAISLTHKLCTDELTALQTSVVAILSGTVTWSVTGDQLTIIPTNVTDVGMVFSRNAG